MENTFRWTNEGSETPYYVFSGTARSYFYVFEVNGLLNYVVWNSDCFHQYKIKIYINISPIQPVIELLSLFRVVYFPGDPVTLPL